MSAVASSPNLEAVTESFFVPPARYLNVGAGAVAYRRFGTGPDVVFVHGFPVSGATFRNLIPHLAPHLTCHVLDLVGAGHSRFDRKTSIGFSPHVETVKKVVDLLELTEFAVVGHDSGGMIARHAFAGEDRLRAMALINTEQPQGLTLRFLLFVWTGVLPGFEHLLGWAAMQPSLRKSPYLLGDCFVDKSRLDGAFEALFLAPLRDHPDRRWAAGELVRSFERRFVSELAGLHEKIAAPVQLVWGEDDPFFPVEWARQMVDTFPNAKLRVIPNSKLFVHEERPAEVAEAILPVLTGRAPVD